MSTTPIRRLTQPQNRWLWGLARKRGLDAEALRNLTPQGSVSRLTVTEASILIDALTDNRRPDYSQRPAATTSIPRQAPGAGPAWLRALPASPRRSN